MTNNLADFAVGKRKSSIARVRFIKGNGKILINNCKPLEYFKRKSLVMVVGQPLVKSQNIRFPYRQSSTSGTHPAIICIWDSLVRVGGPLGGPRAGEGGGGGGLLDCGRA